MTWEEYRKSVTPSEFEKEVIRCLEMNIEEWAQYNDEVAVLERSKVFYISSDVHKIMCHDLKLKMADLEEERKDIISACITKPPYIVEPENEERLSNFNHLICELKDFINLNGHDERVDNLLQYCEDEFNKLTVKRHEEG